MMRFGAVFGALSLFATIGAAAEPKVVPFEDLLRRPVNVRAELRGLHPRLFFTKDALPALRARAAGVDRELWRHAIRNVPALVKPAPPAGSPELDVSKVQYNLGYGIAQAAFAYAIERNPKYLQAAKSWMSAVITYPDWGYTYRTPNIDLPPAHLLYGVSFAYDLLYDELTPAERTAIRGKLVRQSRLMYEAFRKPGRTYPYAQNHTFIPMTGLAMAAFTLMDDEPEARQWAQLARAIYDRTLLTFDTDGYYYEGFHYLAFSAHWMVRYFDALRQNTGEDLYPGMRSRFLPIKYHLAHSMLPGGLNVFDFGDTGRGASERNSAVLEDPVISGYEALYRFAEKYRDPETQGVADWLRSLNTVTYEDIWSFIAHDPTVASAPVSKLPTYHYFANNGTVFWRSGWDKEATAIAFRCGPPEGHHVTALLPRIPEWRLATGHAHPDANSFIVFAGGQYLTGDAGYTGMHFSRDHNTVLVNGRGQGNEAGKHDSFDGFPYPLLDQVRITDVQFDKQSFRVRGEAAGAYPAALQLTRFTRTFQYSPREGIVISDVLEAAAPATFTWVLTADRLIEQTPSGRFSSRNGSTVLEVERMKPERVKSSIEPRIVTSQGRPGSIETGKPDQRGYLLRESTPEPARTVEFVHTLRWKRVGE
jgi:hypothetical protein